MLKVKRHARAVYAQKQITSNISADVNAAMKLWNKTSGQLIRINKIILNYMLKVGVIIQGTNIKNKKYPVLFSLSLLPYPSPNLNMRL